MEGKCSKCYLVNSLCICDKVRHIFKGKGTSVQIILYQHFKEYGRPSNTGKLLLIGLENNTELKIFGNIDDENDMINRATSSTPSFVLSPGENSIPMSSFRQIYKQANGNVNLILVDSTWNQASAMLKNIPASIQRVHIDELSIKSPSQFLSRKQTSDTKTSTIEAFALALQALDDSNDAMISSLYEALRLSVDSLNKQCGLASSYGNDIEPNVMMCDSSTGPFQKAAVARPTGCPTCGTGATKFVNMGLRKPDATRKLSRIWQCKKCSSFFSVEEKESIDRID